MELSKLLSVPDNWNRKSECYEIYEEQLSEYSNDYYYIKNFLNGTALTNLTKITRAQNPYMFHRYQLRKEEYTARNISFKEKVLLHATDATNINSILMDNLDWRRVRRAKFGQGVSFSTCATYANTECSKTNGHKRAILITKVLVGKQISGSYHQDLPEGDFDTTCGNGDKVIVKYYDDEFYPEYIAYYHI